MPYYKSVTSLIELALTCRSEILTKAFGVVLPP